jgi:hypothetical protein
MRLPVTARTAKLDTEFVLAITRAGVTPAKERGIAKPQWPLSPNQPSFFRPFQNK